MPSAVFKTVILGNERPQTYTLDYTATGIGAMELCKLFMIHEGPLNGLLPLF